MKGNCIECGGTKSRASHRFEGFFNEGISRSSPSCISFSDLELDLGTHMLELTRRSYALLDLDERVLEFSISTSNNLSRSPIRLTESDLIRCDDDLKWQFDQMIAESCLSDVRCKNPTTSLTRSALFGVRYLAALFSCDVMQEAERCSDGVRLFNIFVARVEESISKVVDGFNNVQGDERYWSEAASALAILYYGLINVQKGLENHTIRPICVSYFLPT